jgi:two-component system chemotaxis response regulator CheB
MTVRVKVMIVDDSVVVRKILGDCLTADPDIDFLGAAANGRIALAKMAQTVPDVVALDVEMPEMDGLATLAEIRKLYPLLPVVMFSSFTEKAAQTTLEALRRGATDYFAKPSGTGSMAASTEMIRKELVPRLKALGLKGHDGVRHSLRVAMSSRPPGDVVKLPGATKLDIVALGASTGGPNAIADVLEKLPPLAVPMVVTQHMPPLFTRLFAERLNGSTQHKVKEAQDGDVLQPGHILIAPGDFHMVVRRDGLKIKAYLVQTPPENSCRPAVDPMMRSVVDVYGGAILGVVLTGMGQDGLRGCEQIRKAGGQVVVQDEASSVVWGMPGAVARAKLANAIVPLARVATEITTRIAAGRTFGVPAEKGAYGTG